MTKKEVYEACLQATLNFPKMTEEEINEGCCFDWATIVFDLVEGSKIAGHNIGCGHCWVEYRGLCFDSETPHGVRNWKHLPFWVRIRLEVGEHEWKDGTRGLERSAKSWYNGRSQRRAK